ELVPAFRRQAYPLVACAVHLAFVAMCLAEFVVTDRLRCLPSNHHERRQSGLRSIASDATPYKYYCAERKSSCLFKHLPRLPSLGETMADIFLSPSKMVYPILRWRVTIRSLQMKKAAHGRPARKQRRCCGQCRF